jgi:KDO2-lipid IV(A) lauroyltransferase
VSDGRELRDVREGGRWTALQRAKNDSLWLLASVALAMARPVPLAALRVAGRSLGRLALRVAGGARQTADANVRRVFPELPEAERAELVRRCFVHMGELLAESVAMLRGGTSLPPLALSAEARAVLDEAHAEKRGVLFASAHLGPWERVAASLVASGIPLVALGREAYDPRFSRLIERLRGAHGVPILWRARPGAAAGILRVLREGCVLGVPMDLRSRVLSCEAPFLGHDAPTPLGPARIALRARAPVVVGTVAPGPGGLEVTATRVPTADLARDDAGARTLTARINEELSRRILAMPHAWPWMHDRWGPASARAAASGV